MEINTTGTNDGTEKSVRFNEYLDVFTRCYFALVDTFVFNFLPLMHLSYDNNY